MKTETIEKIKSGALAVWAYCKSPATVIWQFWMVIAAQFILWILAEPAIYAVHRLSIMFDLDGSIGTVGATGLSLYRFRRQWLFMLPVFIFVFSKLIKLRVWYWLASMPFWYIWASFINSRMEIGMDVRRVVDPIMGFAVFHVWGTVAVVVLIKFLKWTSKKLPPFIKQQAKLFQERYYKN